MTSIGFGVDLSHHQSPTNVPWEKLKASADFVICRASYGGGLRDRQVAEHMRRARQINMKVGLYQFYRPSQSVESHFKMFKQVADVVQLGDGDILPVLDIEPDVYPAHTPPTPKWQPALQELIGLMKEEWGGVMLYISQKDWSLLGKPSWVLDHPLWCPHFINASKPATPAGREPHIWQHRVGPFDPEGPGGYYKPDAYDHNKLIRPLPFIGDSRIEDPISDDEREAIMGLVALTLDDELRADPARRCV